MSAQHKTDLILITGISLVLLLLMFFRSNLTNYDGFEYGQSARQYAQGHGFSSLVVLPSAIPSNRSDGRFVRESNVALWIVYLANFFKLVGVSDSAIKLSTLPFALLIPLLTYLLGWRLFNRRAALLAALLVASRFLQLRYGVSGRIEPAFNLFILAHFLLLIWSEKRRYQLASLGCLLLAIYFKPIAMVFLLPWAVFTKAKRGRRSFVWLAIAVFALLPLFFWNKVHYGSYGKFYVHQEALNGANTDGASTMARRALPTKNDVSVSPLGFLRNIGPHLQRYFDELQTSWVVVCLLCLLAWYWLQRKRLTHTLVSLLQLHGGYILVMAMAALWSLPLLRYFSFAVPLAMILMAAGIDVWLTYKKLHIAWRLAVVTVALLIFCQPTWHAFAFPHKQQTEQVRLQMQQFVSQQIPSDAMVVSNVPELIAWYTQRTAVLLPMSPDDLSTLLSRQKLDYLLLMHGEFVEGDSPWANYMTAQDHTPWHLQSVLKDQSSGHTLGVLYSYVRLL